MNEKYRAGYQPVPEPEVMSGGAVAQQAMASAAAGASAGAAFGPWGAVIGGAVGGIAGTIGGKVKQKKSKIDNANAVALNDQIADASEQSRGQYNLERKTFLAEDGADGEVVNDMGALVAEYEGVPGKGTEILGTPLFDAEGNLYGFEEKSEAPRVTHEQANGENPDNLIPTMEGKMSGQLPPEIANKPSLDPGDVIIDSQGEKDYNYTKKLIKQTNEGDKSAAKELEKRLNQLPKGDVDNNKGMKKYKNGINSVDSLLKYTGTANNLIRGQEDIEKVNRRLLKGKRQRYKRDVAEEEKKILESRNAAHQAMKGKALSAGQAHGYASNIQVNSDKATSNLESRERAAKRGIEASNIASDNAEDAQNLQLQNTYDDMEARARAIRDRYTDQGMSEISDAAQISERQRYQMMRDEALDERDQRMIDQGLFDTKNRVYSQEEGSTYRRTNRKGTRRYN